MSEQNYNNYFYGNEAELFTFYRFPKALIMDDRYAGLSDSAKILYGLMLDRMGLSMKNGWFDKHNRVYIYFTLEEVQEVMRCGQEKGIKLLAELDSEKGYGLIERKKQGQGKPAIILVRKFIHEAEVKTSEKQRSGQQGNSKSDVAESNNSLRTQKPEGSSNEQGAISPTETPDSAATNGQQTGNTENQRSRLTENQRSAPTENRGLDLGKTEPINTNINKTELSDIEYQSHQSIKNSSSARASASTQQDSKRAMDEIDRYREYIKDNIDYDCLVQQNPFKRESIDELVEAMVEAVTTSKDFLFVGGEKKPSSIVKSVLLKLDFTHIEYVMDCMAKNTSSVRNIKSYLLTSLYNAPQTIDHYFQNQVMHDMYGGKNNE